MPGSVAFDTAVGVIFALLTASLIASAMVEWIGNSLNKRGEYLLRGLRTPAAPPPAQPQPPSA